MTRTAPLISRVHLFGDPAHTGVQISPGGDWLAWLEPVDGVRNIRVAPRARPDAARTVTHERHRGLGGFLWAQNGDHLLYAQDRDGDEIFHIHAVHVADATVRDLTPLPGARGSIVATSRRHPGTLLLGIDDRAAGWPDLWRVDLATGARALLCRNDRLAGFVVDEELTVRAATRMEADGGFTLVRPEPGGGWRDWMAFGAEDARVSAPLGLDAAGTTLYLLDSRGRDTAALVAVDLATGAAAALAGDPRADISGTLADGTTFRPLAAYVTVERREILPLDPAVEADLAALAAAGLGDWSLTSRSADDRWWTIVDGSDVRPGTTWLYDRHTLYAEPLFEGRPALRDAALAPMRPLTIAARDGRWLISYLTLPRDTPPARPVPLVLLVHGGPWMRDVFGYHPEHQWLADRGYGVLSVNFRGSSGFGKAFLLAGDGEWGARWTTTWTTRSTGRSPRGSRTRRGWRSWERAMAVTPCSPR